MNKRNIPGQFEQLVLTAALVLADDAYGISIHRKVNHAMKSDMQIETTMSERWCAPTMMLDHAISEAMAIAPTPSQNRAKRITPANPNEVAVCPEGNELKGGSPIVRRPSRHGP